MSTRNNSVYCPQTSTYKLPTLFKNRILLSKVGGREKQNHVKMAEGPTKSGVIYHWSIFNQSGVFYINGFFPISI